MLNKLNNIEKIFSKAYDKFFKDKNNLINILYYIAIIMLYIVQFNSSSRILILSYSTIERFELIATVLLILKIILTKETLTKYLSFILVIVLAIVCDNCIGLDYHLLTIILIIIGSRNIKIDKVIKLLLCFNILMIGYHCIRYIIDYYNIGLTDTLSFQTEYMRNNRIRHSFYFYHPNVFSNYLFWSWMMWFYLNFDNEKYFIKIIIIGTIFSIISYVFPNSRNASMFYFVAMVLYLVLKHKKIQENEVVKDVISLTFIICFLISWILLIFLDSNVFGNIVQKINSVLSNRILLGKGFLKEYGVSLFGNLFTTERNKVIISDGRVVFDNWYYYMIIRYGLIISGFYFYIFSKSLVKLLNDKKYSKVFVIIIFLAYNCIEVVGVNSSISIPFYFIGMFL